MELELGIRLVDRRVGHFDRCVKRESVDYRKPAIR